MALQLSLLPAQARVAPRPVAEVFATVLGEALAGEAATGEPPIVTTWIDTPVGPMVAAANDRGLCLLEYTDPARLRVQLAALRRRSGGDLVLGEHPHLEQARQELGEYFTGARREFTLPLEAPGSPFQERVWAELCRIPYGATVSYESIALTLGEPGGQRAVGTANGQNRIAIVIPCHRVVRKSGALGGYGGGLWRKEWLLGLEAGSRPAP